jgi:hypothetical protein
MTDWNLSQMFLLFAYPESTSQPAVFSAPSFALRLGCFQMKSSDNRACRLLADLFTDSGGKRRQNAENRD